jgi:hypothetical protein
LLEIEFDINNVDEIIKILDIKLIFDGAPITITRKGKITSHGPYWTLYWKHGFIATPFSEENDKQYAKIFAALFAYLWLKGIPASLADEISHSYSCSRKKLKCQK